VVKPNFIDSDPGIGKGGQSAIFVGRLTEDKGVRTLLKAWEMLGHAGVPLQIYGDGPVASEVECAAKRIPNVRWFGHQPKDVVLAKMKSSAFLIVPSLWYEVFPMVILEAFATGLPVIASDHGSLSTIIDHGKLGVRFEPGNSADLAAKVRWLAEHPDELLAMRRNVRIEHETKYTAERNYELLLRIYENAVHGSALKHGAMSMAT
jgi:glycosyltransferase involved in cell wall biosynthesis